MTTVRQLCPRSGKAGALPGWAHEPAALLLSLLWQSPAKRRLAQSWQARALRLSAGALGVPKKKVWVFLWSGNNRMKAFLSWDLGFAPKISLNPLLHPVLVFGHSSAPCRCYTLIFLLFLQVPFFFFPHYLSSLTNCLGIISVPCLGPPPLSSPIIVWCQHEYFWHECFC